jgi:hypothetical protein
MAQIANVLNSEKTSHFHLFVNSDLFFLRGVHWQSAPFCSLPITVLPFDSSWVRRARFPKRSFPIVSALDGIVDVWSLAPVSGMRERLVFRLEADLAKIVMLGRNRLSDCADCSWNRGNRQSVTGERASIQ